MVGLLEEIADAGPLAVQPDKPMTITYNERFLSPKSIDEANNKRDDKWTKNYIVHGDAGEDETTITTYLAANLPQTITGLVLRPFIKSLKISRTEADDYWNCDAFTVHRQTQRTDHN